MDDAGTPDLQAQVDELTAQVKTLTTDKQVLQSQVDDAENELGIVKEDLDKAQGLLAKQELDISGHKGVIGQQVDLIHSLQDQLKQRSSSAGITPDQVEFDGSVRGLVEHFRRQFCHENQRALILKD